MKKNSNYMHQKKYIIILFLVFGLVFIIFKSYKIFSSSHSKNGDYKAFIVANTRIKKGDTLTLQNTDVVFLDLGLAWTKFIRNAEFESFEGLQVRTDISTFEPILKTNVFDFKYAEENIPKGKRLFVLDAPIGPILSILNINDVIDVIAQIDMPNLGNVTETILEAVKIVAIGNQSNLGASAENAHAFLSFYLTPEEVKIISFMKPYSTFSVVLRNPDDASHSKQNAVTFNGFIQNEKIQKIIQSDAFRIINGRNVKKFRN